MKNQNGIIFLLNFKIKAEKRKKNIFYFEEEFQRPHVNGVTKLLKEKNVCVCVCVRVRERERERREMKK